ncbi:restriction endonuclease subunit S [Mesoflavibacter zeaxanthinifaciens]|uniref:restriction endonuclease subunit S n=1 Tax=Mesoflavibacter zeaxanthinifaciens TaxID=393060 RepID=UPI003A9479C4
MELAKNKFKKTELGLIPEEWKLFKVNDLLELLTDYDANGSFSSVAENVKVYDSENFAWYVRSTDLEKKSSLNNVRYVDEESYRFLKKTPLFGGELLFLKRGDIGRVYLFEMRTKYATVAPNLYLLKLNQKTLPQYLFYYFTSDVGQSQLKSKNASSTLGALYKDDVKAINVPLPPLPEQKAIAQVLSDTDSLIQTLEQKLTKKSAIKQGAMQQLLMPKEEWVVRKLGEIGKTFGGLSGKSKPDFSNGNSKYIPFMNIMSNPVIDTTYLDSVFIKKNEIQNKAIKGDLFFNGSSETPEEVGLCSVLLENIPNLYLNSFCFGFRLFNQEEFNGLYLSYFFRSDEGRKLFYSLAQGATRYNLSKANFLKLEFSIPNPKEQTRIATILSDMDLEIAQLEQKLDKYILLKQGLMQELLTGRIRLIKT